MPDVIYEGFYYALMENVRTLRDDFRSLQLVASDREAPAYEDAVSMTDDVIHRAKRREPK
ncbi:hypothetical protein ACTXJY_00370 [Corynebacterium casei]|uniref:hypothetical protein n=1 Tax=Corynebacterium casei TaxID=160386 RepID=UPI003FCEE82A